MQFPIILALTTVLSLGQAAFSPAEASCRSTTGFTAPIDARSAELPEHFEALAARSQVPEGKVAKIFGRSKTGKKCLNKGKPGICDYMRRCVTTGERNDKHFTWNCV